MLIRPVTFFNQVSASNYRYVRLYKTDSAVGGFYHSEFKIWEGATEVTPTTTGAYTLSVGIANLGIARLYDGDLTNDAFHTDGAGIGSTVTIDLGTAYAIDKFEIWVDGNVPAEWDVEGSNDASTWTTLFTGFDMRGGAGKKTATW